MMNMLQSSKSGADRVSQDSRASKKGFRREQGRDGGSRRWSSVSDDVFLVQTCSNRANLVQIESLKTPELPKNASEENKGGTAELTGGRRCSATCFWYIHAPNRWLQIGVFLVQNSLVVVGVRRGPEALSLKYSLRHIDKFKSGQHDFGVHLRRRG